MSHQRVGDDHELQVQHAGTCSCTTSSRAGRTHEIRPKSLPVWMSEGPRALASRATLPNFKDDCTVCQGEGAGGGGGGAGRRPAATVENQRQGLGKTT